MESYDLSVNLRSLPWDNTRVTGRVLNAWARYFDQRDLPPTLENVRNVYLLSRASGYWDVPNIGPKSDEHLRSAIGKSGVICKLPSKINFHMRRTVREETVDLPTSMHDAALKYGYFDDGNWVAFG